MPVTIWDLITQLAGLPAYGADSPNPEDFSGSPFGPPLPSQPPSLAEYLAPDPSASPQALGPMWQSAHGYGFGPRTMQFHPQVPLDPSQVQDLRPWWGFTLPHAPFYDPVPQWRPNPFAVGLPMGEWVWPPGGGYPGGP